MITTVKDTQKYAQFLQTHPETSFMQGPEWAKVKDDNWQNEVIISEDEAGNIRGSLSVLIRKVPMFPCTMMYAPRGPVCDVDDKETFAELIEGAKQIAKKHNCYVLKLDPDVESENEAFTQMVRSMGFRLKNASKNFEGIQPRFVFRLDIKDKTEDEVMEVFHSKTRYNIRLAVRKGVTVRLGTREDLKTFHDIMVVTGTRDEFVVRTLGYFEKMYDCLGSEFVRLYLAEHEGKVIAGTLAIYYGNKVWYLYGASANEARNVMPNYLLQWEMIRWAIEKKCDIYDFRGVSGDLDESNPLYGLYRFKKGFNGKFTEFIGEMDYVFSPFWYVVVEKGEKIYRELRRRLYLLRGQK
ncbi:MAG: peptidoglycan bridge formation glycyltransferase FemA/FemB family protein [Ruminococcaceae bacterium]|nr:peptidoglycan bridge formation glycyltransferase FemA/FemB family protein [Oscillospiraceae bacterium]